MAEIDISFPRMASHRLSSFGPLRFQHVNSRPDGHEGAFCYQGQGVVFLWDLGRMKHAQTCWKTFFQESQCTLVLTFEIRVLETYRASTQAILLTAFQEWYCWNHMPRMETQSYIVASVMDRRVIKSPPITLGWGNNNVIDCSNVLFPDHACLIAVVVGARGEDGICKGE